MYNWPICCNYSICVYFLICYLNCALVHALRLCTGRTAHRGSRSIALLFLDHGTRRGEGSASRPSSSLPPGKTRYPLYSRLGGPQGRSGEVRKISPPPGFDPRTVQPVASRYADYATRPTDLLLLLLLLLSLMCLISTHTYFIFSVLLFLVV